MFKQVKMHIWFHMSQLFRLHNNIDLKFYLRHYHPRYSSHSNWKWCDIYLIVLGKMLNITSVFSTSVLCMKTSTEVEKRIEFTNTPETAKVGTHSVCPYLPKYGTRLWLLLRVKEHVQGSNHVVLGKYLKEKSSSS